MIAMAPFETFYEHDIRSKSDEPYSDEFIARCRTKASEYDKGDRFVRPSLLRSLKENVPMHFRDKVFDGIKQDYQKISREAVESAGAPYALKKVERREVASRDN
jgi:hypothetical protein